MTHPLCFLGNGLHPGTVVPYSTSLVSRTCSSLKDWHCQSNWWTTNILMVITFHTGLNRVRTRSTPRVSGPQNENLRFEVCSPVGQQRERRVKRTLFYARTHEALSIREYGVSCFKCPPCQMSVGNGDRGAK